GSSSHPVTRARCTRHGRRRLRPPGGTLLYTDGARDPDGSWLPPDRATVPARGGQATLLTEDEFPDDGAEFTPDGAWILFNSERGSAVPGHAQLFRMRPDGSGIEQRTHDERVNWFPYLSPGGTRVAFVSFPPGTQGHPADLEVLLRLCAPDGTAVRDLVPLRGGQGTMNVNSWAPDSRRLAYVD